MARWLGVLHLYFVLTFQNWALNPDSFTAYGLRSMLTVPLWPGLPRPELWLLQALLLALSLTGLAGWLLAERGFLRVSRWLLGVLVVAKLFLYGYDLELLKPYHHMHLLLSLVTLCSGLSMARLCVGLIYFTAAWGKLNPSWLAGQYFNSVPGKLPGFPQAEGLVTALSLAVVVLELVGPWLFAFLPRTRPAVLLAFVLFHLYSGLIVGLFFPLLMLPTLWALFWPLPEGRVTRPTVATVLWMSLVLVGSAWPFALPGDVRLTGEGQYLSLSNMFDANRSVVFEAQLELPEQPLSLRVERGYPSSGFYQAPTRVWIQQPGGPRRQLEGPLILRDQVLIHPGLFSRLNVRLVGDPYVYYAWMSEVRRRFSPLRFSGTLFVWLNGQQPAWRVFRLPDFAREAPEYQWFAHNNWLQPQAWRP
ncbi:hypothetical protein ABS71_13430 [bacterium SCN 62-11]|nr:MAG: hypothetical protein ABS71_13430 [bacterium SCN 62-11]